MFKWKFSLQYNILFRFISFVCFTWKTCLNRNDSQPEIRIFIETSKLIIHSSSRKHSIQSFQPPRFPLHPFFPHFSCLRIFSLIFRTSSCEIRHQTIVESFLFWCAKYKFDFEWQNDLKNSQRVWLALVHQMNHWFLCFTIRVPICKYQIAIDSNLSSLSMEFGRYFGRNELSRNWLLFAVFHLAASSDIQIFSSKYVVVVLKTSLWYFSLSF